MKAKFKKLMKNQKGMTLIELLAVIVIIAIIALIAIPAISNVIQNSKDKAVLSDASQIISSAKIAISDGACDGDTTACTQTNMSDYLEKANIPEGTTYSVTKSSGVYTLTYSGFTKLSSSSKSATAFKAVATGTDKTTITSDKLAEVMGNK